MLVGKVVQFAALAAAVLWHSTTDAATAASVKFCGRQLGEIMSRVCHAYNSPSWDVPTVVEQPGATVRRRRQLGGIADECCIIGCTWEQLSEYCSISAYSVSPLEDLQDHIIADRSAEQEGGAVSGAKGGTRASAVAGETGTARATGAAAAQTPMADLVINAARAAPVVGTVSPLITWGRTLNTDLPLAERDRYAYVVFK